MAGVRGACMMREGFCPFSKKRTSSKEEIPFCIHFTVLYSVGGANMRFVER